MLLFLHEKNDLGIHTEMFSEGVVDLYNEGVVTNRRKTLHRDKMVANFLMERAASTTSWTTTRP